MFNLPLAYCLCIQRNKKWTCMSIEYDDDAFNMNWWTVQTNFTTTMQMLTWLKLMYLKFILALAVADSPRIIIILYVWYMQYVSVFGVSELRICVVVMWYLWLWSFSDGRRTRTCKNELYVRPRTIFYCAFYNINTSTKKCDHFSAVIYEKFFIQNIPLYCITHTVHHASAKMRGLRWDESECNDVAF